MPAELWRPSLDLALHRNRHHYQMRLVQLATVRPDSRPSIRTVVFRGFLDDARRLVFTTDVRSSKRGEIENNPYGEICWYFPETREQFRLAGLLSLVDDCTPDAGLREARGDVWGGLSDATRLSFTWPAPGEPRDHDSPFPSVPPDASHPVETFCLMILTATEVDHLELQGDPQHRWKYEADPRGRWSGREVNP
ncbi:Npun_F5749 family FMN-dependent PPOX-type flavoprotein [Paludisphaera mucosa]|uniref:Pyridoxamine 5'-phosphate oxidase family protein n=1 Tax=Paludisphaera mucosa TaxID=3030827 RepID=A0ABT6F6U3_9BACT|nr:Npun_F5749 family FMN-dependent PPOX-type flavoprotein [Paludisphaera mucosa]MDG3003133.1 pyridoxamine 5'-phosphate oxidase family protein [Paludisphaera mucosa]